MWFEILPERFHLPNIKNCFYLYNIRKNIFLSYFDPAFWLEL